ncbi:MAG: type II toxin-antitoxin system VapC family toxin [Thermodesulfobacteriota bacterium]
MNFYLDTSVLAAYYCPEPLSEKAEEFVLNHFRPAISALTEVEFCSAISRKIRERGLSQRDGGRIIAKFLAHIDGRLYMNLPIEPHHFRLAREWISLFNNSLRSLDAIHLAITSSREYIFVTADKGLSKSAEGLAIETILL